jgi:hypothetical protein
MSSTPTESQHSDLFALFRETHTMSGLSEDGIFDLLDFTEILLRENKRLRSQIETDNEYRTELEVEKFALQIELHEKEQNNG